MPVRASVVEQLCQDSRQNYVKFERAASGGESFPVEADSVIRFRRERIGMLGEPSVSDSQVPGRTNAAVAWTSRREVRFYSQLWGWAGALKNA